MSMPQCGHYYLWLLMLQKKKIIAYTCTFFVCSHHDITLEGDLGKEVALWLLTSLCTSAEREVEVAL